ncbi:MAG: hypothetical protein VKO01_12995 [Cyanobacteriota bacterium]|nr:hypothetical protein [Cyanobacteriota bacterium]
MSKLSSYSSNRPRTHERPYQSRSATTYLEAMAPEIRATLTAEQLGEMERVIKLALPQPAPKIIDLRVDVDLLVGRFFIVLFVGKDRRRSPRQQATRPLTAALNWLTAMVLLLGVNLLISVSLFAFAYLIKSAIGINLTPGHLGDYIRHLSSP